MLRVLLPVVLLANVLAMPLYLDERAICKGSSCEKPDRKYELIQPSQPGYQWNDAGGYCGAWAIQRATLAKGAYISQQQVRDHTVPGGGHDNEILSTNIDEAFKNLKIQVKSFDYTNTPLPQQKAYFKWLKRQLVAGHTVAWMIMWSGQDYPIYNLTAPAGMYGHVEPVIGIQSNHPLTDEKVYDDDVLVHYTDGGMNTVYKVLSTLLGDWDGPGSPAVCRSGHYCIGPYAFGWAIEGFVDDGDQRSLPASLSIDPSESEPDIRKRELPDAITGTLTVTGLTPGATYVIYRWDSVHTAFIYNEQFRKFAFKATNASFVYVDPMTFQSDSSVYFRCVVIASPNYTLQRSAVI
jgi:hypothetical protein